MATVTRYSVAKTARSYGGDPICGSKVKSETEDWKGSVAYGDSAGGALSTDRLTPNTGACA